MIFFFLQDFCEKIMASNSSEPWRVSEKEMREYERITGHPMSEATRDALEFEYERAYDLAQEMSCSEKGWPVKNISPQP